ncbi:MAG: hypothetical protein V8R46_08465 [Eubacterium ramulus]
MPELSVHSATGKIEDDTRDEVGGSVPQVGFFRRLSGDLVI